MSEQPTVEARLSAWLKQPGTRVTPAERQFIVDMRQAVDEGVGYGWMQQVIEWEWQTEGEKAWGPEYFQARITTLEAQLTAAQAAREAAERETGQWVKELAAWAVEAQTQKQRAEAAEQGIEQVWLNHIATHDNTEGGVPPVSRMLADIGETLGNLTAEAEAAEARERALRATMSEIQGIAHEEPEGGWASLTPLAIASRLALCGVFATKVLSEPAPTPPTGDGDAGREG